MHSQQVWWWHKTAGVVEGYFRGLCHHPEGTQQAREMGPQKPVWLWAQNETQEVLSDCQATFFYSEGDWNRLSREVVKSLCSEIIKKLSGYGPEIPAVSGPTWVQVEANGLQSSFLTSTILCFDSINQSLRNTGQIKSKGYQA